MQNPEAGQQRCSTEDLQIESSWWENLKPGQHKFRHTNLGLAPAPELLPVPLTACCVPALQASSASCSWCAQSDPKLLITTWPVACPSASRLALLMLFCWASLPQCLQEPFTTPLPETCGRHCHSLCRRIEKTTPSGIPTGWKLRDSKWGVSRNAETKRYQLNLSVSLCLVFSLLLMPARKRGLFVIRTSIHLTTWLINRHMIRSGHSGPHLRLLLFPLAQHKAMAPAIGDPHPRLLQQAETQCPAQQRQGSQPHITGLLQIW